MSWIWTTAAEWYGASCITRAAGSWFLTSGSSTTAQGVSAGEWRDRSRRAVEIIQSGNLAIPVMWDECLETPGQGLDLEERIAER